MNTPIIAGIIIATLMVGSGFAIMNKASNSSYQALCAPISARHHYSAGCLMTTADLR